MRAQYMKRRNGCSVRSNVIGMVMLACLAVFAVMVLVGCADKAAQLKIVTPYGVYDTTTTGTTVIDTTPLFGEQLPPPIDYSKYPSGQLEK